MALLLKWWWRLKNFPNQLWARVIVSTHGNSKSYRSIRVKKCLPGVWKDIVAMESEFKKSNLDIHQCLKANFGDGSLVKDYYKKVGNTILWEWKWTRDPLSNLEWAELGSLMRVLTTHSMTGNHDTWEWLNNHGSIINKNQNQQNDHDNITFTSLLRLIIIIIIILLHIAALNRH
ncbi:hypothetical protein QVD17_37599 [Tagetes erecta]|uniref:Uncharacterized protein n=1 Tax=Tagetes erecta TaxID=13708 RepID=A0AAD8K0T9_TARER|nr:hypothetical protein QVD17_37599 [Tagetes erecta]